jgi:hypothetical protein
MKTEVQKIKKDCGKYTPATTRWPSKPKRADVTYEELAERLKKHGQNDTKASMAEKLGRGVFIALIVQAEFNMIF